ncbi:MAG: glycoside hydrolase family 16 protein [Microscillaceae bacterium]|nr:glycoside hydrolase family 16 protein [Microscillaceae bacterium]
MKTQIKTALFASLGLSLLLMGCEIDAVQTLPERNWELVWSDEFEGPAGAAPDPTNWTYDLGGGGWGNEEFQVYTNNPQNVALDGNGQLVITAIRTAGPNYTSGRIKSKGLFEQQYGRFEARIKTPTGPGIWPAFWMLGSNIDAVNWPNCGEIDIMEQRGQQSAITYGSVHGPGYSGGNALTKPYGLRDGRFDTDFYVYAVEWGADYIDFFVDGFLYKRVTPEDATGEWVFNQPFFMLLNVAVGGTFVGFPTSETPFPQSMYIDYVRVYKQR